MNILRYLRILRILRYLRNLCRLRGWSFCVICVICVFFRRLRLCEQMGLTIPGPELFKIAGAIAATEAVKSGLELLIPSASTAMTFR